MQSVKKKRRARGEGTAGWVVINGQKYWRIYHRGQKDEITGKPIIPPVYAKTKIEAEEKYEKLKKENLINNRNTEFKQFGPFFEAWIWNIKRAQLKAGSFENLEVLYRVHFLPLKGFYHKNITEINTQYLQNVTNYLLQKNSINVVKKFNSYIGAALNYAVKIGVIRDNPMHSIVYMGANEEQYNIQDAGDADFVPVEDQKRLIEAVKGSVYEGIFMAGIMSGLRCSEILCLTESDINFRGKYINVNKQIRFVWDGEFTDETKKHKVYERRVVTPKTRGSVRQVPLPDALAAVIKKQIEHNEYCKKNNPDYKDLGLIFCSDDGYYVGNNSPNNAIKRISAKLGLKPLHFHSTRHMFVTNCIDNNINIKTIMEWTGHTESKILMLYAQKNKERNRAEYSKINAIF